MSADKAPLWAPELPRTLPPVAETGPVVIVTGMRNQARSRWIPTLSTAWFHPDALNRPVVAIVPDHQLNSRVGIQHLLFALGKDPHVTGAVYKDAGNLDLAAAWLLARETREIIVRDADVAAASFLRTLVELAVGVGARIWLIAHSNREDKLDSIAELWDGDRISLDTFDQWWARPEGRLPRARRMPPTPVSCDLPYSAALMFRADCRRMLPIERFAEVDALYVTEHTTARTGFAQRIENGESFTHEKLLHHLRARIREQNEPWEVLTVARAIEAAALWFGFDVDIDQHQLMNAAERNPRIGRLGREEFAAFDAYSRPSWCASVALTACEIPLGSICDMTVGDISDDGSTVKHGSEIVEIPETLRPYLVAQLLIRRFEGATDDSPALTTKWGTQATTTWVSRVAKVAEVECGVRLFRPRADRRRPNAAEWGTAHGISVRTLSGSAASRKQRS